MRASFGGTRTFHRLLGYRGSGVEPRSFQLAAPRIYVIREPDLGTLEESLNMIRPLGYLQLLAPPQVGLTSVA